MPKMNLPVPSNLYHYMRIYVWEWLFLLANLGCVLHNADLLAWNLVKNIALANDLPE